MTVKSTDSVPRPKNFNDLIYKPNKYSKFYKKAFPNSALLKHNAIKSFVLTKDFNPTKPFYSSAISFTVDEVAPDIKYDIFWRQTEVGSHRCTNEYKLCPLCNPLKREKGQIMTRVNIHHKREFVYLEPREPVFYSSTDGAYSRHMCYSHGITKNTVFEDNHIKYDALIDDEPESFAEKENKRKEEIAAQALRKQLQQQEDELVHQVEEAMIDEGFEIDRTGTSGESDDEDAESIISEEL